MTPDKYTLWKSLHPGEWHCNYCRKSMGTNICVDFLFADDGYDKDCRRFLDKDCYTTPEAEEKKFTANILKNREARANFLIVSPNVAKALEKLGKK